MITDYTSEVEIVVQLRQSLFDARLLIDSLRSNIRDLEIDLAMHQPRQQTITQPKTVKRERIMPRVEPQSKNSGGYTCPHCDASLRSKQARGAAVKNGYCLNCKTRQAV